MPQAVPRDSEVAAQPDRTTRLEAVRSALSRGEFLLAFDQADQAVDAYPGDTLLQYYAVLSLARAGATDRAEEELERFGFDRHTQPGTSAVLAEDVATLRARLAKDRALAASGSQRLARARRAAELYEAIFLRLRRPYACINAATMWLLAGDDARAAELARSAVNLTRRQTPGSAAESYWVFATEAEAALILGDSAAATEALTRAAAESVDDVAARATTRKQLALVCAAKNIGTETLAPLFVPPVIHYCGHMISPPGVVGPFPAENEALVAGHIAEYVKRKRPGFAFGSLACGSDILFAEALLAERAELHIVLPFRVDDFKEVSVRHGGTRWLHRFDRCLEQAASISHSSEDDYVDDVALFDYAARIAMGRALIRARFLAAEVEQVAVWDALPPTAVGGTASNVQAWQERTGRHTHVIAPSVNAIDPDPGAPSTTAARALRAVLFADVKGFSRLRNGQLTRFLDAVLQPLAHALDRFGDDVLYRNSWGDGLYVVLRDVVAAAGCALALQDTMRAIDLETAGLPSDLGLRIGAHAGPVVEAEDPIRHEPNFYGHCVTRTARIEPRTPEGSVYATDAFAALLMLEADDSVSCQYVGHIPTAKDYGTFPMYRLTRPI